MHRPRRITFLITALSDGGAERQLVYLAGSLQERGWQVQVITMISPSTRAFTGELEQLGIPWTSLEMPQGVPDLRGVFRLRTLLKRHRPEVVHSHMVHANLLARVVRCVTPVPVLISTAHNIDEGGRWLELAYRLTDPLCNLTTNVSQAAVDRYIERRLVPRGRIRFIPNGLDCQTFAPRSDWRQELRRTLGLESQFVWLAVGRIEAQKDYPTMLRALAALDQGTLLLVGEGTLRTQMTTLAAELGLAERVRFLGMRSDVPALMSAADAYLMSSAWEGMPMVLLEASAGALPIVATAVGGNHEVVRDGISGFLVPPRDSNALAAAMTRLMAAPDEERRRMGCAGQAYVRARYDLTHIVDRWVEIYDEQLQQKGYSEGLPSASV